VKTGGNHSHHIFGVIKDALLIVLIFAVFYLIDLELAAFIAVICTAILLIRRIVLDYNPGFVTGHHLIINEKEVIAPKGVDIFHLSKAPTMDDLRCYSEIIRTILVPPAVLIIRFCGMLQLEEYDLNLLSEITGRLQKSDIEIIFSDVGAGVWCQIKEFGINQQLGNSNICCSIDDSMKRADQLLHRRNVK